MNQKSILNKKSTFNEIFLNNYFPLYKKDAHYFKNKKRNPIFFYLSIIDNNKNTTTDFYFLNYIIFLNKRKT